MIKLTDQRYWLYAAVDFKTNDVEIGTARSDVTRLIGKADNAVERVFQERNTESNIFLWWAEPINE